MQSSPSQEEIDEYRRLHSPLFNDQKLKLGLFGINTSGGMTMTRAETSYEVTWEHTSKIAKFADQIGFEVLIPIARWKGFGGDTDFGGRNFETYTWAAGLAATTERITLVATSHLPTVHPIMAAKMATTVDHISSGRIALNMVMGWFGSEMEMFGVDQRERLDRYEFGQEWVDIVRQLWTSDDYIDYAGKNLQVKQAIAKPRPIQVPYPILINAGNSPAGVDFSARNVDINFAAVHSVEDAREHSKHVREVAWTKYKRKLNVMMSAFVICRDTEEEALEARRRILELGDYAGAANLANAMTGNSGSFDKQAREGLDPWVLSFGAFVFFGTPEQVAQQFKDISDAGIDGVAISFLDYYEELKHFNERVMPLLKEIGLRH